jgi:restriction system protein
MGGSLIFDNQYLEQFFEFIEFRTKTEDSEEEEEKQDVNFEDKTPKEVLENAYQTIREDLAQELLEKVKESPPDFFEKLVIDLLINMGYGGSRRDAGKVIGKVYD